MMSPKCKQDKVENNKQEKRVARRNPVLFQRTRSIYNATTKGNIKENKALPKVKHSFIAQMASIEKDMVGEYVQQGMRKKKYSASLKGKK